MIVGMRILAIAATFLTLSIASKARADIQIGIAVPVTGHYAWCGEQTRLGVDMAVQDLNERGGVLSEALAVVPVDDFCDPDQAAAAKKLVADGVPFVVGHQCSGAAIPAFEIYEDADIVFISPAATTPS